MIGAGRRWLQTAAAALLLATGAAAQAAPSSLTLAMVDNPNASPVLIADAMGYFAAEGLTLKLLHCAFGRICLKHLLDGEAQVAGVTDTPITFASFARKDFAVIATLATSGREHRMVVRNDRGILEPKDLKGKRIGTLSGTSGHYFTETFLRFHGIEPAEVTIVTLKADDASAALVRGTVDAAGLFNPHGIDALRQLGTIGRVLPMPGFFSVHFNLVSVPSAAGASDADLARLLRGLRRAYELMQNEPAKSRDIVARALGADAKAIDDMGKDFDFRMQLAPTLISSLEAQARWALRARLVPAESKLPDYLDFIRAEPLRQVEPRAVRLAK